MTLIETTRDKIYATALVIVAVVIVGITASIVFGS